MRLIKLLTVFLAVIILVGSAVVFLTSLGDKDAPVMKCTEEGDINGVVATTDEELLKYVTATDKQDGDLSDKIKVIRKKYFVSNKTTVITYAVCDSDNNVTTLQKRLVMADYYSPRIELKSDFIFPGGYTYNLADYVTVVDCVDGDISDYMKLISSEFANAEGVYPVNIKISNSMADSASLTINTIVTYKDYFNTKVRLNKYITYVKKGEEIDYKSIIKDIYSKSGAQYAADEVVVDNSAVDMSKAGVYDAFYRLYSGEEIVTMTRLVVVVEEN